MSKVNWSELTNTSSGQQYLVDFANGQISRDDMISLFPELRNCIRERGVREARNLVRKSLRRRGVSV